MTLDNKIKKIMLKDRKQRGITVHKDHTLQSNTKYAVAFSKTKRFPTTNPMYYSPHSAALKLSTPLTLICQTATQL